MTSPQRRTKTGVQQRSRRKAPIHQLAVFKIAPEALACEMMHIHNNIYTLNVNKYSVVDQDKQRFLGESLCAGRGQQMYLKADFFKLCLDVFHEAHVPAVDKVLPTPLLQQQRSRDSSAARFHLCIFTSCVHRTHLVATDFLERSVNV